MKKLLLCLVGIVFIIGCGSNTEEKKSFKGVTAKRDYIADGMNYLKQSDVKRAIQSFDLAIRQDPTNPENYVVLSQVYMRLKSYDRAVDSLQGAARVAPKNGEVQYLLATAHMLNENPEKAVESAKKSVDLFMQSRDEEKFKKAVLLLKSLTEASQPDDAASTAETMMEPATNTPNME
ncbi:MAG: tetratricopeptide repeat protein [Candidatus Omnitrophica bacterium]|nr:tetratricopeptide repeat protein [Candidatus Omnitrophota bacterium]